jgi:hypothetical protein
MHHAEIVTRRKSVGAKMPTPHKTGEKPPGMGQRKRQAAGE